MRLSDGADKKKIIKRLERACGQIKGVCKMIERDAECADVATQLSACKHAINQALGAFALCSVNQTRGKGKKTCTAEEAEKIIKLIV